MTFDSPGAWNASTNGGNGARRVQRIDIEALGRERDDPVGIRTEVRIDEVLVVERSDMKTALTASTPKA